MLDRLLWESSVVMADILAHSVSSWSTSVSSERNDGLVFENSLEIADSLKEVEASASSSSLIGVLIMSSQVINNEVAQSSQIKVAKQLYAYGRPVIDNQGQR